MADLIRAALERLVAASRFPGLVAALKYQRARDAAPTPEPDTNAVLKLAAIIREVDGSHSLGAAALAETILSHSAAHEVFAAPPPPADGEAEQLAQWLEDLGDDYDDLYRSPSALIRPRLARAAALLRESRPQPVPVATPGEQYHEDMGPVLWWRFPIEEPPYVGTPNDSDWPGYHTHYTPVATPTEPTTPTETNG